ncbi:hypothetical protein HJG60_011235 [Phyllostomus discolor]|uniref:Uncharacterized protein n=1 Tax=Phyllostomus discolor TaxID=89673 RepID=A0A834A3P8_9CHIR|nr:hypothetical protein HJG60_011235 [Phyllostomus discolor]
MDQAFLLVLVAAHSMPLGKQVPVYLNFLLFFNSSFFIVLPKFLTSLLGQLFHWSLYITCEFSCCPMRRKNNLKCASPHAGLPLACFSYIMKASLHSAVSLCRPQANSPSHPPQTALPPSGPQRPPS